MNWNQQQRALQESIEHWTRMRNDPVECFERGEIPDGYSCALCGATVVCDCTGCIIDQWSGRACWQTPYYSTADLFFEMIEATGDYDEDDYPIDIMNPTPEQITAWQSAADVQIAFLQSLLFSSSLAGSCNGGE